MNFLIPVLHSGVPPGPREGPEYRRRVEWLMLIRIFVTSFLLLLTVVLQFTPGLSFVYDPTAPIYIILGNTFVLSLLYALAVPKVSDLKAFSFLQVLIDTVYTTALVAFTGGASSIFTLLYVFPIIASGILHLKRGAIAVASASSLLFGLLTTLQFYGIVPENPWPWVAQWQNHDPGYVLWVVIVDFAIFFVVAILAGSVAQQLSRTRVSLGLREIAFEKLSELHTNIVESIGTGIVTTDSEDRITFVNSPGTTILGMKLPNLIDLPIGAVFSDIQDEDYEQSIKRVSRVKVSEVLGEQRTIEYAVTDLKERDGRRAGRLVVFQDVTEIRKMEEQAKLSEKQAAFVRIAAGMAHEIRNPLASLRGAAELLSQSVSDVVHRQKLLGIVMRESDRLNSLLNDFILTVDSRQSNTVRVSLSDLVQETVGRFTQQLCAPRGIGVESKISSNLDVVGQPHRLRQAVWNLLANAAEASPDSSRVRVVLQPDGDQAVLTVQDSGPGIPHELRDKIFEPFSTTKEFGTGLGLPLILSTVEAHNGTIEVQSGVDQGAVFVIRLPLGSRDVTPKPGELNDV